MARKIWRYTMTHHEQTLWDNDEMKGWRDAMRACVEDDAREQGCNKYILYASSEEIVAKGEVTKLPEPEALTN